MMRMILLDRLLHAEQATMTPPDPGQEIAHIYEKYFRHHAHMLIAWGHQRAVASIQPDSDEPDISGFLAEAIRNLLATGSYRWFQHLWGEYAEYTARYPEVGMLGYVLTETPARWHEQLKKAIDAHAELLQLNAPQFAVNIVDELPFEWGSEHKRTSADTHITIYHILLDCSS